MLPELLQKSSLFHFSIELIPILPTNAAREGALFAVAIYIKQHTSVNREAVRKASLQSTLFDKACAVGAKIVGEGVYRYRVYLWADGFIGSGVILVVMALRQNRPESAGTGELMRMFGMTRKTLFRWMSYFREAFPSSAQWQKLRGRVHSSIIDSELPGDLLRYFIRYADSAEAGLVGCLRFLATGLGGP